MLDSGIVCWQWCSIGSLQRYLRWFGTASAKSFKGNEKWILGGG